MSLQAEMERQYRRLQDLTNQRRNKLNDSKKLFEFYREADETENWISDKSVIAGSEDYGTDLEHVEVSVMCDRLSSLTLYRSQHTRELISTQYTSHKYNTKDLSHLQ